jgi:hypothetical protein
MEVLIQSPAAALVKCPPTPPGASSVVRAGVAERMAEEMRTLAGAVE